MMRIAIIAYACSPIRGSEPGMAWNIISRLNVSSTSFDIYVEQEKFQEEILDYLQNHPLQNINFFFLRKRRMRLLRKLYPHLAIGFIETGTKMCIKLFLKNHMT